MYHLQISKGLLSYIVSHFKEIYEKIALLPEEQLFDRVNSYLDRLFELINLSILEGEYIENPELAKALITEQKSLLDIFLSVIEGIQIEPPLGHILYNIITILQNSFDSYTVMMIRVESILKVNTGISYLNKDYDREKISDQCEALLKKHSTILYHQFDQSKTSNAYQLLVANIHLALLDLSCNPNEKTFYKLHFIEKTLEELRTDPKLPFNFIYVLIQKATFLKLKVLLRFYQSQKDLGSVLKIIQGSNITTIEELINSVPMAEMVDNLNYAFHHYVDCEDHDKIIASTYRSYKNKSNDYKSRHLEIKYYKDIKKSYEGLKNVVELISDDFKKEQSPFNNYATGVCLNYAHNNLFSFSLENKKLSYSEALEQYENVKQVRIDTGINNYFPELRFLKFLLKKIDFQNDPLSHLESINLFLQKGKELLDIYRRNINWTKYNHSYIYQLPFEECLISNEAIKKAGLKNLFLASSITLPLDKESNYKEFLDYEKQVDVFNNIKDTLVNFNKEKKEVEKIKSDIESKDVKYIEILGIFCAISTFVSAAILSYIGDRMKENDIHYNLQKGTTSSFTFLLSTGIVMIGFLALLVFILNRRHVSRKFSLAILLLLILLIATCNNIH